MRAEFQAATRAPGSPQDVFAAERLEVLFAPLAAASGIVAAVSGGPDSVALLHLLSRWKGDAARPTLIAATVEHGLRPESASEAASVARMADRLHLPHHTLPWIGDKPRRGVQAAAREARYALLTDLARRIGASHLVTAHTLDDQAETVLMRLSRGSGPAGVSGMRPLVERRGVLHARPLLGCRKAALIALCEAHYWSFIDDPSNGDERFARARWRRVMPLLAAEGLTPERLARFAERAHRAEEAINAKARDAFRLARIGPDGPLRLSAAALALEPSEIAVRILVLAVTEACEGAVPLRLERLEGCAEKLIAAARERRPLRVSLAGAVVALDQAGHIVVRAEPMRRRGRERPPAD